MQNVKHTVFRVLKEKLGFSDSEITLDANFAKDLGIDSLDYMELVMELENAFQMSIPETEVTKIRTVGALVDYVESRLAAQREEAA